MSFPAASFHSLLFICVFFFKQKTAYEMRISDWSSDVCSSDLIPGHRVLIHPALLLARIHIGVHVAEDVAMKTEGHSFDQRWPLAGPGSPHGLLRRRVHGERIVAVDMDAGHPVGRGPRGNLVDRRRHFIFRVLTISIVLAEEDDAQLPDRREVERLVKSADIGSSVSEACDGYPPFPSDLCRPG